MLSSKEALTPFASSSDVGHSPFGSRPIYDAVRTYFGEILAVRFPYVAIRDQHASLRALSAPLSETRSTFVECRDAAHHQISSSASLKNRLN